MAGRAHAGPHLAAGWVLVPVCPWAGIAACEADLGIWEVPPSQLRDCWKGRACKPPGKGSAWGREASSLPPCLLRELAKGCSGHAGTGHAGDVYRWQHLGTE